jgi:very-short-patch-repair endonuclease
VRRLTEAGVSARLKSDGAVAIARRLRKAMTPAEKALWFALRKLPLEGTHFRRQAPMGPFIADFVCHSAKLIIELDGGAHRAADVALRDVERQRWIEGRGYRVLRIENARALANSHAVAEEIFAYVKALRLS